jgi:hypothetical protein
MSISWATSIQLTLLRSTLILLSRLQPGLPSGLFDVRYPHRNFVCIFPLTHNCHILLPQILFDLILGIIYTEQYRSRCTSLQSSPSPVISPLLQFQNPFQLKLISLANNQQNFSSQSMSSVIRSVGSGTALTITAPLFFKALENYILTAE